jgi:hypothetical protein
MARLFRIRRGRNWPEGAPETGFGPEDPLPGIGAEDGLAGGEDLGEGDDLGGAVIPSGVIPSGGEIPREGAGGFILLVWVLTAGLAALIANLFRGALPIRWSDLIATRTVVPGGEDIIRVTDNGPDAAGTTTITLRVPPANTWWKAAEMYDATGMLRADAWVQDTKRISTLIVNPAELPGGFFVLKKAKFAGVHTAMYVIPDEPAASGELSLMSGRNLTIDWMMASGEFP